MNRLRGLLLLVLLAAACTGRFGTLPANQDDELDLHEARLVCERWRAFGDHADPRAALERARFALTLTPPPLMDEACMTPAQFSAEALQASEIAAHGMPQDAAVLAVLSNCRLRFGRDPAGAAVAGCQAAELAPADPKRLEVCGDLLVGAGKRLEAIERWTAAVRLTVDDEGAYPLLDKLLAWHDRDDELLESLPPGLVEGYEQWKRAQVALRSAKAMENRAADAAREEKEEKRRREDKGFGSGCPYEDSFTNCPSEYNQRIRDRLEESFLESQTNPWLE